MTLLSNYFFEFILSKILKNSDEKDSVSKRGLLVASSNNFFLPLVTMTPN